MGETGQLDLELHVDPETGKTSESATLEREVAEKVTVVVEVEHDEDGKLTGTIGVKIPF